MQTIETELTFDLFMQGMEKGYSGGGNDKHFTFSSFNGKKLKKPFSVSQDLILAYEGYRVSKQILSNTFNSCSLF